MAILNQEPTDPVLIVVDRDTEENRLATLQEGRAKAGDPPRCAIGLAVEMLEAWLLAPTRKKLPHFDSNLPRQSTLPAWVKSALKASAPLQQKSRRGGSRVEPWGLSPGGLQPCQKLADRPEVDPATTQQPRHSADLSRPMEKAYGQAGGIRGAHGSKSVHSDHKERARRDGLFLLPIFCPAGQNRLTLDLSQSNTL